MDGCGCERRIFQTKSDRTAQEGVMSSVECQSCRNSEHRAAAAVHRSQVRWCGMVGRAQRTNNFRRKSQIEEQEKIIMHRDGNGIVQIDKSWLLRAEFSRQSAGAGTAGEPWSGFLFSLLQVAIGDRRSDRIRPAGQQPQRGERQRDRETESESARGSERAQICVDRRDRETDKLTLFRCAQATICFFFLYMFCWKQWRSVDRSILVVEVSVV